MFKDESATVLQVTTFLSVVSHPEHDERSEADRKSSKSGRTLGLRGTNRAANGVNYLHILQ